MEEKADLPVAVRARLRHVVMAIEDSWRIDDEWWRDQPVSRLYYAVIFTSGLAPSKVEGHRQVLYKDLTDGHWYRQMY